MEVEDVPAAAAAAAGVNLPSDDTRFRVELQFVQMLSNPRYILELVSEGYFNDPSFINYLKYLKYWGTPEYIKYVKYPISLYFLDLLTSKDDFYKNFQDDNFLVFIQDRLVDFTMRNVVYYNTRAKEDYENECQKQKQEQELPPPPQPVAAAAAAGGIPSQ